MGFIIVSRNPRTQRLIVVTDDNDEDPAEFATESEALAVSQAVPICVAWGYQVVEVDGLQ